MTQVVSNRTGREKINTAEGENTEFSVEVKNKKITKSEIFYKIK